MSNDSSFRADWDFVVGSVADAITQYDVNDPTADESWQRDIRRLIQVPGTKTLDTFEMYRVIEALLLLVPRLIRCIPVEHQDPVLDNFFELAIKEVLADATSRVDLGPPLRTDQLQAMLSNLAGMSLADFAHTLNTSPGMESILHEALVHAELEVLEDAERRGWTLGQPPDDDVINLW